MNNPPAFPCPVGHIECYHPAGMTLRDYFAAKALQGLLAGEYSDAPEENIAAYAYAQADAMLAEREKSTETTKE